MEHVINIDNTLSTCSNEVIGKIDLSKTSNHTFKLLLTDVDRMHELMKNVKHNIKFLKIAQQNDIVTSQNKKSTKAKALYVPQPISKLLKLNDNIKLPRKMIIQLVYLYIKENNLYDVNDERTIVPNKDLKQVFNLNDDEQLSFYNIQSHIKKLY
jgi:hypothetical protein